MATALAVLLGVVVLAHAAIVALFVRYIAERDQREMADRQTWANRVQAPQAAVVSTMDVTPTPRESLFIAPDDDDAYAAAFGGVV